MAEKKCTRAITSGRLTKAREFRLAAELVEDGAAGSDDLNAAYITLCVHAGIAAADVICCRRLNVHHHGESHEAAVTLLGRVDRQLAGDLAVSADRKQAKRAMERLVGAAEATRAGSSS